MELFPVVFYTFKFVVLGIGMYFAVKWHYDQGKKGKEQQGERRTVLLAAGKVATIFVMSLVVLGLLTWSLVSSLRLDLSLP